MEAKQYMIVDLDKFDNKSKFITKRVSSIELNYHGQWTVYFSTSQHPFNYNQSRLLYLTNPEKVDLTERGLYINNKHITNIKELYCFKDEKHTFYHAIYDNEYYDNFEGKNVYVSRTPINKNGGNTWDYLNKLAAETGLETEDNGNILTKQYELIDLNRDNVPLAQYLGNKKSLKVHKSPNLILFPFGCNASQKTAVEQALTHQVSIIQGPPGTGKTQTILNIIANLIIANKTVLVVSNNNSAVENVEEKLTKVGLDFILAQLGSVKNKENFIANQKGCPYMDDWILNEGLSDTKDLTSNILKKVSQGFILQTQRAKLSTEYNALLKEAKYNDMLETNAHGDDWLYNKNSTKLLKLLNLYKRITEEGQKLNIWFRLRWSFTLGLKMFSFLNKIPSDIISKLESSYYSSRKAEIENELDNINLKLQDIDLKENLKQMQSSSLIILKDEIAKRYNNRKRIKFAEVKNIKPQSEQFLNEYPVVLSTTYSAKNCISNDMVFDYVIMDEASQVDIKTGALALSCALNAVIVGDDKQLPNVINSEEELALKAILSNYKVEDKYNAITHSFLQSCTEVFKDAPTTLLREHYRCHPQIIEFCNKRFYDGELITMTSDDNDENVLKLIRTAKGNHAREHINQREIDVIQQEILQEYCNMGTIGIITPYRLQAEKINGTLGNDIASTVHKYQGRECDTIIMSMVDNTRTEFSDDPNLLNVAISRAKKHLCIVVNGNDMEPDSNIAQLTEYIKYNNFEIKDSKLHSVFDLLYKQYSKERLEYETSHPKVSEYLSENLIYDMLIKAITESELTNIDILCHYPLSRLIGDWGLLDNKEIGFAKSPLSHVDFLIYNSLTKQPYCTIEVDGWKYHQGNEVQQSRDKIKDSILSKIGLTLHRITTTDTVTQETIQQIINSIK